MSFIGLASPIDIEILPSGMKREDWIPNVGNVSPGNFHYLVHSGNVRGLVSVTLKKALVKFKHFGIKVILLGVCGFGSSSETFLSMEQVLSPPGVISEDVRFPFMFSNVQPPYESFHGQKFKVCYLLKAIVGQRFSDAVGSVEIAFAAPWLRVASTTGLRTEMGVEDNLLLECEYDKSGYNCRDVIRGIVLFICVKLKISRGNIAVFKREITYSGSKPKVVEEVVGESEILDGHVECGDMVPIRLFLAPLNLNTTISIDGKFANQYFLQLSLFDEDDRCYFKRDEITIWRKDCHLD